VVFLLRGETVHKRDEIVAAIKKCAERLGRAPSQAEFRRASKISWYQVYKHFRGMRQAVRAAGLEPGPRGGALDINALTLDWARVVRKLGRLPSRAEYSEQGIHHAGTLHARIVWSQMAHKFVLMVKEFHLEREWEDVVKIVVGKFPLLETSIQRSALSIQPEGEKTFAAKDAEGAKEEERNTYHGDTETRRTAEYLPLIATDNTDRQHGGMRLGKVVAAALAIEILMAADRSNWQLEKTSHRKGRNGRKGRGKRNLSWRCSGNARTVASRRSMRGTSIERAASSVWRTAGAGGNGACSDERARGVVSVWDSGGGPGVPGGAAAGGVS
jgi:hypothetical protein